MGSVVNGIRHFVGEIGGPIADLFDKLGPFKYLLMVPPLTTVFAIGEAAKAAKAIGQDPPDWGGFIEGVVGAAVPLAAGRALQLLKSGGTAGSFAKIFGEKMGTAIDDVILKMPGAEKIGALGNKWDDVLAQVKGKFTGQAAQDQMEKDILSANPGKTASDTLTNEELVQKAGPTWATTMKTQAMTMVPTMLMQKAMMPKPAAVSQEVSAFEKLTPAQKAAQINQESEANIKAFTPTENAPAPFSATDANKGKIIP